MKCIRFLLVFLLLACAVNGHGGEEEHEHSGLDSGHSGDNEEHSSTILSEEGTQETDHSLINENEDTSLDGEKDGGKDHHRKTPNTNNTEDHDNPSNNEQGSEDAGQEHHSSERTALTKHDKTTTRKHKLKDRHGNGGHHSTKSNQEKKPTNKPTMQHTTENQTKTISITSPGILPTTKHSRMISVIQQTLMMLARLQENVRMLLKLQNEHDTEKTKLVSHLWQFFGPEKKSKNQEKTEKTHHAEQRRKKRDVVNKKRSNLIGLREDIKAKIEAYFPCRHPKTQTPVKSGTSYFNRKKCKRCHCEMGKWSCKKDLEKCYPNSCHLMNNEIIPNLALHNDGCNNCLCHFGKLICTHLRCRENGHFYTDYKSNGMLNADPELTSASLKLTSERATRAPDMCLECDHVPGPYVCGRKQWKTFPSLCHAIFCGGNRNKEIEDATCENLNPCKFSTCKKDEKCLPRVRVPCLHGRKSDFLCEQYICIPEDLRCMNESRNTEPTCGNDGNTYTSECEMISKGIQLAYEGPCKDWCNSEVCGIEGRPVKSRCHAGNSNSHIDYPGRCEYHYTTPLMVDNENKTSSYHDGRCDLVYQNQRCRPVKCHTVVVPPGACCPVCGSAFAISLNMEVSNVRSLDAIYQFILKQQDESLPRFCKTTIDLTYAMDVLVILRPYQLNHLAVCDDMATEIIDMINTGRDDSRDKTLSLLGAATLIQPIKVTKIDLNFFLES